MDVYCKNRQDEYRGVWLSFLDWEQVDFSSAQRFSQQMQKLVSNCAELGLNTLIAHVRPFGDALYESTLFPSSHIMTGTQGKNPGFDPLKLLIEETHRQGLRVDAWINPYRISRPGHPETLAPSNPALRYMGDPAHAHWVLPAQGGLYYNPAIAEIQDLIADGVREVAQNYAVDSIQFDDYFYPETDPNFDAATWKPLITQDQLADWRRENVNQMVRKVYQAVKSVRPDLPFGISPQGNNTINLNEQYSDIPLWMREGGYIDYVMPQIYWGFGAQNPQENIIPTFNESIAHWTALPRLNTVALYIGLAAYKVGLAPGESSQGRDLSDWQSGHNLGDMVQALHQQKDVQGYAFFRYDSLFRPEDETLMDKEAAALKQAIGTEKG